MFCLVVWLAEFPRAVSFTAFHRSLEFSPDSVPILFAMCLMYLHFASLTAMLRSFVASFRSDRIWGSVGPVEALCRARSSDTLSMVGCSVSLLSSNQSDGGLLMVVAVDRAASLTVRKKSE